MSKFLNKSRVFQPFTPILCKIEAMNPVNWKHRIPREKNNFSSIARFISKIENNNLKFTKIRNENKVNVTSITGAPGVGKSTVLNELIDISLSKGKSVAVLMLDPRSSISGGSFLGDRLRLNLDYPAKGVFLRSAAFSQSNLADSIKIKSILNLYKYLEFDDIYLEAIGADQNNLNFKKLSDVVVNIPNNLNEDWVQVLKSDNLDMADVFFVNKNDIQSTEAALQAVMLKNSLSPDQVTNKKVLLGSAINKVGIRELYDEIHNFMGEKNVN